LVTLIKDLECHFADAINPQHINTHTSPKHVSFGSRAVNELLLRILIAILASMVWWIMIWCCTMTSIWGLVLMSKFAFQALTICPALAHLVKYFAGDWTSHG
jgi:hypothetical protein